MAPGLGLAHSGHSVGVQTSVRREAREVARPAAALLGAASALVALLGVLLMQRTDAAPLFSGLPSGLLATVFPNSGWIIAGTMLVVLGCVGVVRWLPAYWPWEQQAAFPPPVWRATPGLSALPRRVSRAALFFALAGIAFYVFVLLHTHSAQAGGVVIVCFVAAVTLLGLALRQLTRENGGAKGGSANATWPTRLGAAWRAGLGLTRLDALVIAAIVAAFIAVCAHDLRSWVFAYIGDEWPFYTLAKAIAGGAAFDPLSQAGVYGYHPVMDSVYQGLVMRVFGLNVVGWRLSCVLATALAVIPLYWGAKQMGGALFAASASVIYAACPLLWAFSHIGYNEEDPLFMMILAGMLCYVGLRDARPVLLYAAGACAGAGWYSLYIGRLMIVALFVLLLTEWRGGWPAFWRRMALLLGGFALVVAPLFLDNGLDTIRQMLPLASMTPGSRAVLPASVLLQQNTVRAIYAFLYATMDDHYTVGALFDVVSAAALCIGVALALRRWRSLPSRLLLSWFLVTTALTSPIYYVPTVSDTRSMVIVPAAALLAALGLCAVGGALGAAGSAALSRRGRRLIPALGVSGALGAVILLNGFHDYAYATLLPHYWPPYPVVVSAMEAITTQPHATFILPADMPAQNVNGDLCTVLDGFQVDLSTVLRDTQGQLAPYCAIAPARSLTPSPHLVLLIDSAATMQRCVGPPSATYVQNQATLWAYRLNVPARPPGGYVDWIARHAAQLCPTLAA